MFKTNSYILPDEICAHAYLKAAIYVLKNSTVLILKESAIIYKL